MVLINISEIAKLAKVSVATVSRVINKTGPVAPKTKENIEKIIEKYGYEPNLLGKHLRKKETRIILVVLTTIVNSFYAKVVDAMDKKAKEHGYNIVLCTTNDDRDTEQSYLNLLRNGLCDGCIILNTTMTKEEMHEMLERYNIVQCNEYIDDSYPYISIDNKKAAYDAVSYLIKTGRKKIAYCGVINHFISSKHRYAGYVQALKDNDIKHDKSIIFDGNYGFRSASELTEKLLKSGAEFDALFAISDRMAAGAMSAIINCGKKIPDDIAVMGFDNVHLSYMVTPALSTVAQPQAEMGEAAFMALLDKMSKQTYEKKILNHKLIIRKSTD